MKNDNTCVFHIHFAEKNVICSAESEDFTPWCKICDSLITIPAIRTGINKTCTLRYFCNEVLNLLHGKTKYQYQCFCVHESATKCKTFALTTISVFSVSFFAYRVNICISNFFWKNKTYLVKNFEFQNATSWHHGGM